MSTVAPSEATNCEPVRSWPDEIPEPVRTLGWAVLEWTAKWLQQPDGPDAGQSWRFTPEQTRIVLRWYAVDDHGRFLYRRGVLRRMKGWGKDPFLAALAAVELCGPCRFSGWNFHPKYGHLLAVPHPAPWVQVAAVSKDQTRNTMTLFPGLISPACIDEYGIDPGKEIIHTRKGGRIEAVTSSPRALEGGRPSLVIANETHHWLASNDGLDMSEAIKRNLGKSRDGAARAVEITNAHLPGEGSAAEQTYEAWVQSGGNMPGVYYDSTEAPPIADLSDTDAVRSGLLAARGDSVWLDVDRVLEEIMDPVTPESVSRRFYLNQVFEVAAEDWLPAGSWAARARSGPVPDGSTVMLGVDGSYNDDSTGILVASVGFEPHLDVVGCWENPDARSGEWQVPILEVEDAIRAACKRWRVREVLFDPYRWARSMQVLAGEGIPVVEYPQSPERMIPASQRFFEAVVNGTLTHSGDPRLARHIGNATVKEDSRGRRIKKETKWSPRKIDLAVCAVMAHDRAASRRPSGGRDWLESLAQSAEPLDESPAEVQEEPAPTEPDQTGSWSPWTALPPQQMPDQTRAALDMLRNLPQPGR